MYNLKTTILSLPIIIGCEEFPKSEHGKLLVEDIENFINSQYHYNGKTVAEAFEMAATYQLFLDGKRVDPSTFGKFLSRASVGKILTAYKEHKRDSTARPSGYNYKQLPEAPVQKVTPSEAWEMILRWTKEDKKLPLAAPYKLAYEYLLEKGQVNPVQKTTSNGRFSGAIAGFSYPERESVEKYLLQNVLA